MCDNLSRTLRLVFCGIIGLKGNANCNGWFLNP